MAAERQSDKMTSNMGMHKKQRCAIEFLHVEKIAIDVHRCLLNTYGVLTVYMSTVRWWVMCFSSGGSSSGSPPLVQIVAGAACRLLFIAGESAQLLVVITLKNSVL